MNILVVNAGSSSLKYQLIDMDRECVLAKGICENVGLVSAQIIHRKGVEAQIRIQSDLPDHRAAIQKVIHLLVSPDIGVIDSLMEIGAVGHRIVHGGEQFKGSVILDEQVLQAIRDCVAIAPLHNPSNIAGIEACRMAMPDVPMAAVFDTAFHQTLDEKAYTYALPYEFYEKYKIRKYGFHGTSHMYVANRAVQMLGRKPEDLKLIVCHLGNGASICAVKGGKSVDTSLGFTPLDGLPMGTRSGSIDPAIMKYIMDKEQINIDEMDALLNKKSGVLGISGVSSDFRVIESAASAGNKQCRLALEVFCYHVKRYIGSYTAVLGGVDAVVFTAGIGENSALIRSMSLEGLEFMGIRIDLQKNQSGGCEVDISAGNARVRTLIIATNEELMIARETVKLIAGMSCIAA